MELNNKFGHYIHLFCLLYRFVAQEWIQNEAEKSYSLCRLAGQKKTARLVIKKNSCYIDT